MTGSKLMKAALAAGQEDDATIAAALDVLREEDGCSLLEAVLEVSRIHQKMSDAKDMAEARSYLAPTSAIRDALNLSILENCVGLRPDASPLLLIVDGSSAPQAARRHDDGSLLTYSTVLVSVGASWVKREASRIIQEREKHKGNGKGRRSR